MLNLIAYSFIRIDSAWSFMKIVNFLFIVLSVVISFTLSVSAAIYAGSNNGWLVVSSHSQQHVAIDKARSYSRQFPTVVVFRSSNGYFGVSVGWVRNNQSKSIIRNLVSSGYIPSDSYVHNGKRWVQAIWTANNSHLSGAITLLNSSRLSAPGNANPPVQVDPTPTTPNITPVSPTRALVGGLKRTGDNYLSLRQGPGTSHAEILRMRPDTELTITGKTTRWYRVRLNNGATGFAYAKYVKIARIPIVGPDNTTKTEVPIVGPQKKPEPDIQIATPKEDKATITKPGNQDNVDIQNQKRVALVLGNSDYEHTAALANPKNDADAIASKLEKLGFTVIKGLDLSKAGMESSIRDFVRELSGADVALFFYAGHAMEVGGTNYLIPVNAALEDATAIDFETINFNVILEFMNEENRTSIALLDACRNNPLARTFRKRLGKARSAFVGRGLAAPSTNDGQLLIGLATSPGEVALDGEGDNSPFTTALLKHMDTPGLEIELMLKRVKSDVFEETNGDQSPWNNSALRKEFYFAK